MESRPSIPQPGGEMHPRPDPKASLPPEHAFVVQFRADANCLGRPQAGRVEHIVSGRAARFSGPAELLAFMASVLGTPGAPPATPARRRIASERRADGGEQGGAR